MQTAKSPLFSLIILFIQTHTLLIIVGFMVANAVSPPGCLDTFISQPECLFDDLPWSPPRTSLVPEKDKVASLLSSRQTQSYNQMESEMDFIHIGDGWFDVRSLNGKLVGLISQTDTDGEHVFQPVGDGVWNVYMLDAVSHKLVALNNKTG